MPKPALEIQGLNKLVRNLNRAGETGLTEEIKKANREAAESVKEEARPLAPVRTGTLASSLRHGGGKKAGVVRLGGAKIPYAGPIHFGWPRIPEPSGFRKNVAGLFGKKIHQGTKARAKGGPIPPNPFLYEALDRKGQEVLDIYYERIEAVLDAITND